jgi:hypothetical protein
MRFAFMTFRGKSHREEVFLHAVVVTLLLTHLVPSIRPWSAKRWDGTLSEIGIWNPKSTLSIKSERLVLFEIM